ncbi:tetratricopeptide repeat protein [Waterburya agarophytonicola K14]|uniref:Tetratricopeptide repeat protein n=1 Tax=Waterburya agarophytonicola KI4 TaxID=2874699 RepID=A0A964BRJ2_9CYAN|nr:tetratricopeptide repeat protein [Waterburya agarophytonicola]MCC0177248.1 tetratricopeptide repeat protein [Waterburya agarophytonicola KI4]
MFIKTQEQQTDRGTENLPEDTVSKQEQTKLADALTAYLQSIKVNEAQPAWIYGNTITLSAQINRFDIGIALKEKAQKLYPEDESISRAIALLYEKQNLQEQAIEFYQKSIELNPVQPEWIYLKLFDLLIENKLIKQAEDIRNQGLKYFPQSTKLQSKYTEALAKSSNKVDLNCTSILNSKSARATPKSVEHNVELNVAQVRRQLMDSSIVEQYEIILEQMLYHGDQATQKMDKATLIHCLAEIKTDIHYLKTKFLEPPAATVDPQAKQNVDLEKIVDLVRPIPLKCELKNRIVGSGWHGAEKHGRWTGPGTLASIVLPYPVAGNYRLEIIVRSEAKPGLLKTLKIHLNDQPLDISIDLEKASFPSVIRAKIAIESQNQPFLSIDLTIDETVNPQASDTRLIGLLIESISLIPLTSIN